MKRILKSFSILATLVSGLMVSSCAPQILTPDKTTPSYVALEVYSGRVLYSSNANIKRPIGMLTNVATAAVVLDWVSTQSIDLNTIIEVPAEALRWQRTNLLKLRPGDRLSLRDALYSALLWDDSACATAAAIACGRTLDESDPEEAFIAEMNKLALRLGMTSTTFKGTNGAVITQSSARDMALLGMYALLDTNLRNITSQRYVTANIYTPRGMRTQVIRNNNRLLPTAENVDGIKVAQSRSAGSCLMVSSSRASVKRVNPTTGKPGTYGQRLLVVMLGMPSSGARYNTAGQFLANGWDAWDRWLPSNDYQDHTKFISLPN